MSEWQPIETAPKDGTCVLLYATVGQMLCPEPESVAGKWSRGWWGNGIPLSHVTHWMPLPEPPT